MPDALQILPSWRRFLPWLLVLGAPLATPVGAVVMGDEEPAPDIVIPGIDAEPGDSPVLVGNITVDALQKSSPQDAYELLSENLDALNVERVTGGTEDNLTEKYEQAAALIQQGDAEAAEKLLLDILAVAPGHTRANTLLGLARYLKGDLEGARSILDAQAQSGDPVVNKVLAAIHLRGNRPEDALAILQGGNGLQPTDPDVMTMLGVAQLAEGDVDEGVETLRDALALAPERHALRIRLAEYLVASQRFADAEAELDQIPADSGFANRADELRIGILIQRQAVDEARRLASAWDERAPYDTRALTVAAGLALMQQDNDTARALLERAVAADASNVVARTYLGNLALAQRDWDTASAQYQAALELLPENVTALKGLVTVEEARGNRSGVVPMLEARIKAQPQLLAPRLVLAEYQLRNGNYDAARQHADKAWEMNPEAPYARQVLNTLLYTTARAAANERRWDAARADLDRMLEISPDNPAAIAMLANVEAATGNRTKADALARQLADTWPDAHYADEVRGDIETRAGNHAKAADFYTAAWKRNRNVTLAAKLIAAHRRADRSDAVIGLLEDWTRDAPDNGGAGLLLAETLLSTGRNAEAIAEYERVLGLVPDNAIALNNLAWLYFETGDERAEATARRANELVADSADILDTLGWILVEKGQLEEGVPLLERAVELNPRNPTVLQHLQTGLERQGNSARAAEIASRLQALAG